MADLTTAMSSFIKLVPNVGKFDGDNSNAGVKVWFRRWENAGKVTCGCSNDELVRSFPMFLEGTAENWWFEVLSDVERSGKWAHGEDQHLIVNTGVMESLTQEAITKLQAGGLHANAILDSDGALLKFKDIRKSFLEHFDPWEIGLDITDFWADLSQGTRSVGEYYRVFLTMKAEWEEKGNMVMPSDYFVDRFFKGLRPELMTYYHTTTGTYTNPPSLQVAYENAITGQKVEEATRKAEERKGDRGVHVLDAGRVQSSFSSQSSQPSQSSPFQSFMRTVQKGDRYCVFCLTKEHSTFRCEVAEKYHQGEAKLSTKFYCGNIGSSSNSSSVSSSNSCCGSSHSFPGIRTASGIDGTSFPVLLDSGANVSVVHISLVKELGWQMKERGGYIDSIGGPIQVVGEIREKVTVGGVSKLVDAFVVERMGKEFSMIIGGDLVEVSFKDEERKEELGGLNVV